MSRDADVTTADGGTAPRPTSGDIRAELRGDTAPAAAVGHDLDPEDGGGGGGHGTAGGHGAKVGMSALALGALGVVFGDIGTSPLYAFKESFEHHHLPVTET